MSQLPGPKRPWAEDQFGTPEDLQAAGTVIAAWNFCEQVLAHLLLRTLQIDDPLNARLFNLLSGPARYDLLTVEAKDKLDPEEFARVEVFVNHMKICEGNRNLVAHASYNRNAIDGGLSLLKAPRKDGARKNVFRVSTKEMWGIAEATYNLAQWGSRLLLAIWAGPQRVLTAGDRQIPVPLPDIPPQPRKLDPSPSSD